MPPKVNEKGQLYPWAIKDKNFAMHESIFKYGSFIVGLAGLVNKDVEKQIGARLFAGNEAMGDNPTILEDCNQGKYVGGTVKNRYEGFIKIGSEHQGYTYYLTPEQEKTWMERYKQDAAVGKQTSEKMRGLYAGKMDERSRHLDEKANEIADWIDLQTHAYDPEAGDITEAEMHAPYLYFLNVESAASPRFPDKGFEHCVDVLEQKGVEGGQNIYDDYMTMMTAGPRETKLQYERQKMEATGWNAQKEAEYLRKLRFEHEKTVKAFDNLWAVDDKGQYDSVLNNELDAMVGKKPNHNRDANAAVGYMRGEMQAIDAGYDSRHLSVLGQIGAQDQILKKATVNLETDLREREELYKQQMLDEKDPAKKKKIEDDYRANKQELEQKQVLLQEYKKDFQKLKDEVWNKRVSSAEEMEDVGKQVDDFFDTHRKKYASIQQQRDGMRICMDYGKQLAKESPVLDRPQSKKISRKDESLVSTAAVSASIDGLDNTAVSKYTEIANNYQNDDQGYLLPKSEKQIKSFAADLAETFDKKIEELSADKTYPNARAYQKQRNLTVKKYLENFSNGIMNVDGSPLQDRSFGSFKNMKILEDNQCFEPQNIAKTDKAVAELGLVEYGQKALKLQEMHENFELNKDIMTPAERRKAYREIIDAKKDMMSLLQKMDKKLENPSEEVKYLFVNDFQLKDVRGDRSIGGTLKMYSEDIMKVDVPQAEQMKTALAKFNTSRSVVFKEESDAHKKMREAAEQVEKDIERLQKGTVVDEKSKKERAMTQKEKEKFLKEAWKHTKELDDLSDKYVTHATKNGTKTPNTPAGKKRLAGARDMKALTGQLKEELAAQPELREVAYKEKLYEQREAKYGETAAKHYAEIDRENEKFKSMSQIQFHDSSLAAQAFGLNNWEYQAARMIAAASVQEQFEQGKLPADEMKTQIQSNIRKVAKDEGFQKWVKKASDDPERMKALGEKTPKEIKADFIMSLSKEMEKTAENLKKEDPNAGKKVDKKAEKNNGKDSKNLEKKEDLIKS